MMSEILLALHPQEYECWISQSCANANSSTLYYYVAYLQMCKFIYTLLLCSLLIDHEKDTSNLLTTISTKLMIQIVHDLDNHIHMTFSPIWSMTSIRKESMCELVGDNSYEIQNEDSY